MSSVPSSNVVPLPPGTAISPGRETVQTGPNGQPIQGMTYTLTLANGAVTSVFIPYTLMSNTALVSQMFAERVNAINGVTALGG